MNEPAIPDLPVVVLQIGRADPGARYVRISVRMGIDDGGPEMIGVMEVPLELWRATSPQLSPGDRCMLSVDYRRDGNSGPYISAVTALRRLDPVNSTRGSDTLQ